MLVLLVSINTSQLKLLIFLVKSQNLWNVLKIEASTPNNL